MSDIDYIIKHNKQDNLPWQVLKVYLKPLGGGKHLKVERLHSLHKTEAEAIESAKKDSAQHIGG